MAAAATMLLPLFCISQNRVFRHAENINTGIHSTNSYPDKIVGCYFQENIYATTADNSTGSELTISQFNINTHASVAIQIKKSKSTSTLFGRSILALSVRGDKFYLLNSSYLNILKRQGDQLVFIKAIENKPSFNTIHPLGENTLLLSVNYNFHPMDEAHKHTWAKFDLAKDSLQPEIYRNEENARFSYFVNSWLTTYKGLIAYSKTTEYNIRFYNNDFQLQDSIVVDDLKSNDAVLHLLPMGNEYSTDEMKKIRAVDDSLLHRIEKIFLVDSNNLLVTIRRPKSKTYRFDLWQKYSGKWKLLNSQLVENNYIENTRYTPANNQIHGFFGNHSIVVSDENGTFYNYYFPFRENVISDSFNMQKDVVDPTNELTRKNRLFYGVRKLKIVTE